MTTVPNPDPSIRTLKTSTCLSLSGKSTLKYDIGCDTQAEIQFRVLENSSAGFFSKEWIPMGAIATVLDKLPKGKSVTSATFLPIFRGKSINTSGFLLAVLKQEGLVQSMPSNLRVYEALDPEPFMGAVNELIGAAGDVAVKATVVPKKPAIQKAKGKKA